MIEIYDLFYKWVPVYIRLPVLFFLFFVVLVANGIFLGNATEAASSLGVYGEPYTEGYNAMYIGMGLGLIFELRLKLRFSNKTLLLTGFTSMLAMNMVCGFTDHPYLAVLACLILGFTKIMALVELYAIWLFVWSKKGDTTRLYPFVYFVALCGVHITTWLTTYIAHRYNWRYAYLLIYGFLLISLLLVVLFVERHPLKKRIPLYQVDYAGLILLTTSLMLLNYGVVNGRVENWFDSNRIKLALTGSLISFILFMKRELSVKRPFFDLSLFRKPNFSLGLVYFFLLGVFIPSTFQSAFSSAVLQYEPIRNIEVNLYMIPGIVVSCMLCYFWYKYQFDADLLIAIGFLGFVLYHGWMYSSFNPRFSIDDFWLPSLIKGFSTGIIYIAVGLYTTRNFTLDKVVSVGGMMVIVRSFLGSGVFSGLYNYLLYAERIKHFVYQADRIDINDTYLVKQTSIQNIQLAAILNASKTISGYIVIVGIVLSILLLFKFLFKKIKSGQPDKASEPQPY